MEDKMEKILDNISLYLSFLKISLKEILIYRLDCIVGIISQLIVQAVSLIFIFIAISSPHHQPRVQSAAPLSKNNTAAV